MRPSHSWDSLGKMVFFHSCNRSGLFSQAALNTISRFSMVTIEKGQGFDTGQAGCAALQERPPCAEAMIKEQLRRVKMHNTRVTTVFYMNLVLDWYFYDMHTMLESKPAWQLLDSRSGKPMRVSGDKVFDPPPEGLLVFNHAVGEMREHWKKICIKSGADGCFADSSQEGSHLTSYYLNNEDGAAFEEGKVQTMRELTVQFSGRPGKPYNQYFPKGVLLGKHAGQRGINAFQIENFEANEQSIAELVEGVQRGYLVQVHGRRGTHIEFEHGCRGQDKEKYTDVVAAFLIGAGKERVLTGVGIACLIVAFFVARMFLACCI
uniref:Beta-galactosidase n=1 Tax=Chrysotila carterae TaxID=13221 RepID=A0A7S4B460_CHRCT